MVQSLTGSTQAAVTSGQTPGPDTISGPGSVFVGRGRELAVLRARLDAARAGEGGVVLLVGEPGIGKTRLAQAFAAEARSSGVAVYWGRAFEGDWSPAYGLWSEILGDYLRNLPRERLDEALDRLGPAAATLAKIVPAIRGLVPDASPAAGLGPDEERFQLYDAVAGLLSQAASERPIVVVLDDLHWADRGSIGLLRYLLRIVPRSRLLIIASMRDAELDVGERRASLTELLAALYREPSFSRLALAGFSEAEVDALVAATVARTVHPALGRAVHGETGGNPFYVQEVIRHLLDEQGLVERDGVWTAAGSFRELGVPEGVRQVVNRRLVRLTEPTHTLLGYASVFTGGAEVAVLQALTGFDEGTLLDAIDEALAAGLIRPAPGKPETYEFSHAIIRSALYEERSPSRNVRLHRQVAEALEAVHGSQPTAARAHAAELAAQYHASASLPGAERGIHHARVAAEVARAGFDRDGAVRFLRMARDLAATADAATRAEILATLAVAEAEALELDAAVQTTAEALAAFDAAGADGLEVAGFLQDVTLALKSGGADAAIWRPLVDRGLALCGEERNLTWARLSLIHDPIEPIAGTPLKAGIWKGFDSEAIRIARASGNQDDYARTIESFDPRSVEETRALVRLGRTWRQPSAVLRALTVAANDLQYRHGAFAEAIEVWTEQGALAERVGAISWQAQAHQQLTFLWLAQGDFERARTAEATARALLSRFGPYRESDVLAMEMATGFAWYLGGDWPAIASYWTEFVTVPSGSLTSAAANDFSLLAGPLYAAMAALAHVECGTPAGAAEARRLLSLLVPLLQRVGNELGTQNQNGAIGFAAAAAWRLNAAEFATPLRSMARDLVDAGFGDYPQTSLHLSIARMAALRGDLTEATNAFAQARTTLAANGQRPLLAVVDLDEGTLLARTKGADQRRAAALLESAEQAFSALGMQPWTERAMAARAALGPGGGRPTLPAGLTEREVDVLRLVGRGYSDRQISEELFISTRTVNAHLRNMFAKAGVSNRTELSVWASSHGLLDHTADDDRE